jgi:hypothetical protein
VDAPHWQALFTDERFGVLRSYVRPFGAAIMSAGPDEARRRLRGNAAVVLSPERRDDALCLAATARRRRAALVLRRPGDVGGETHSDALAQLPLRWLLAKASLHGLAFKRNIELDAEASAGAIEDSFSDFLGAPKRCTAAGSATGDVGREPEKRSQTTVHTINETIDKSVFDRWRRDPAYRPNNLVD